MESDEPIASPDAEPIRGGGRGAVSLDESVVSLDERAENLVALDEALTRLGELNPRLGRMVECRLQRLLGCCERPEGWPDGRPDVGAPASLWGSSSYGIAAPHCRTVVRFDQKVLRAPSSASMPDMGLKPNEVFDELPPHRMPIRATLLPPFQ